jgi:soluble lytic murein transglycosylase-like protein
MRWGWRTLPSGLVEVLDVDARGMMVPGTARIPTIANPRVLDNVVAVWGHLAARKSAEHDVPVPWILATIYAESGFLLKDRTQASIDVQSRAVSPTGDSGVMQVSPVLARMMHLSNRDLFTPELNIDAGTRHLAKLRLLNGSDLPAVASVYNCGDNGVGKPRTSSGAWGLCESPEYILRVVSASNYIAQAEVYDRETLRPLGGDVVLLLAFALLAWGSSLAFGLGLS